MKRALLAAIVAAMAGGCAVGPDYERPALDLPASWRIEAAADAAIANTAWWKQFGDPVLDELIDTALRENRDLAIATARVDRYLGVLTTTRAQFFPQFGYNADASRNRASETGVTPLPPGTDPYYELYQAGLTAAWEIDLFGRVRRLSEAARANALASEQARRGVILTVVTTIANSYIGLRALDRQLEIARATAKNYAGTLKVFESRYRGGIVSSLELSQAQSQYQQAQAAVPALERQVAAQENLLSVLLGRNPGPIPRGKTIEQLAAPAIPAGLPASLLERRPDVLQAEQNLVAANASIGAARALYFPSFSITGFAGTVSAALSDFATSPSASGFVAGTLAGPLFTFGAVSGQVASAEAAQREALAFYQQVVQNALRDTNDALVGVQKRGEEYRALAERVESLRRYARLSRLRFDNGVASYLEVLYAENELFSAELTAVRALAERNVELVNVYKTLGGGWVTLADPLTKSKAN